MLKSIIYTIEDEMVRRVFLSEVCVRGRRRVCQMDMWVYQADRPQHRYQFLRQLTAEPGAWNAGFAQIRSDTSPVSSETGNCQNTGTVLACSCLHA